MKILVVGSGGREDTLCWKLSKSERVDKIFCAPGNGGTGKFAENVNIEANDLENLRKFAVENQIDLTIVGPEEPLVLGIVDYFEEENLKVFGADKKAAQLEGSKEFSKDFMERHGISTAAYGAYTSYEDAVEVLGDYSYPLVIKADGLCAGKGVIICENEEESLAALDEILNQRVFGEEGSKVVIEEFLDGIEASLLCFVSGNKLIPMESAKDYKKIFDGDEGPNTGGVGCYSPSPLFTNDLVDKINREIIDKIERGLEEDNLQYTGILFIGFMIVDGNPKVLEFNVRFGDPETEVVLPRLKSDLIEVLEKTMDKDLKMEDLIWDDKACLTVVMTSENYPGKVETGFEIDGLENLDSSIMVFHNGTKKEDGKYYTNGGRVLSITSMGEDILDARDKVYNNIESIDFDGAFYRKDIGKF